MNKNSYEELVKGVSENLNLTEQETESLALSFLEYIMMVQEEKKRIEIIDRKGNRLLLVPLKVCNLQDVDMNDLFVELSLF